MLGVHVNILGTVELWRTAGTNSIGAQCLNSLFLDRFARVQVVEVVGS